METEELLQDCFKSEGARYGYNDINASFAEYGDLKVRWQRTTGWANFTVSDYLRDAPEDVLRGLATTIFDRIAGKEREYPEDMKEYLSSPSFRKRYQKEYIRRHKDFKNTPVGEFRNLNDVYNSLVLQGLVRLDQDVSLTWSRQCGPTGPGQSSVLMKVVQVYDYLDSDHVPKYVLEWIVYKELCKLIIGFGKTGKEQETEYRRLLDLYPERTKAERFIEGDSELSPLR